MRGDFQLQGFGGIAFVAFPQVYPVESLFSEVDVVVEDIVFQFVVVQPVVGVVEGGVAAVQEQEGPFFIFQRFGKYHQIFAVDVFHSLHAEFVLVDGDDLFVGENSARGVGHVAQVVAGDQW